MVGLRHKLKKARQRLRKGSKVKAPRQVDAAEKPPEPAAQAEGTEILTTVEQAERARLENQAPALNPHIPFVVSAIEGVAFEKPVQESLTLDDLINAEQRLLDAPLPVFESKLLTEAEQVALLAIQPSQQALLAELAPVVEQAQAFAEQSRAKATLRAYRTKWKAWVKWCHERGFASLPGDAAALALYLTVRVEEGMSVATLSQTLSAIRHYHREAGAVMPQADPQVQKVWEGIRRALGVAPKRQARSLDTEELGRLVGEGRSLIAIRNRALLLVGWLGAFRRSELVTVSLSDVKEESRGFVIRVPKSKRNQRGEKIENKVIDRGEHEPTCPVRALQEWLKVSGITEGFVFRSVRGGSIGDRLQGEDVTRILRRAAKRANIPLDLLSAHSLRSGFITTSARAGIPILEIAEQTGQTIATTQGYIRGMDLMNKGVAKKLGL